MPRLVIPVSEITQNTRNWTAHVLVMRKMSPRQSPITGKKYQRFLFIDKDGTQVQATIYGTDISAMENALQLQETYFISNAKVDLIPTQYQIVPNSYQWTIGKTTAICRDKETSLPKELGALQFTKFANLPPLVNTKTMIDILAIVVDKLEQKTVSTNPNFGGSTVQELIVVNDEKTPILLSLWNEVIFTEGANLLNITTKMPIITATRLLVTNYRGTSLSAKGSANIIVNPTYPESQYLRSWRAKNYPFLHELVRQKKYLERSTPRLPIHHDDFSSVANVITNNTDDKFWVRVEAKVTDEDQRFWYMACSSCLRSTTGEYDCKIMCNFCHAETITKPRAKFAITLSDKLTPLDVVMFGEQAESILGLNAFELMQLADEDKHPDFIDINKHLEHKEFVMHIKKRMTETHFGCEYRYTVISLMQPENLPMQTETETEATSASLRSPQVSLLASVRPLQQIIILVVSMMEWYCGGDIEDSAVPRNKEMLDRLPSLYNLSSWGKIVRDFNSSRRSPVKGEEELYSIENMFFSEVEQLTSSVSGGAYHTSCQQSAYSDENSDKQLKDLDAFDDADDIFLYNCTLWASNSSFHARASI